MREIFRHHTSVAVGSSPPSTAVELVSLPAGLDSLFLPLGVSTICSELLVAAPPDSFQGPKGDWDRDTSGHQGGPFAKSYVAVAMLSHRHTHRLI